MINVNAYLDCRFHSTQYTCLHFVRDVWRDSFGVDLTHALIAIHDNGDMACRKYLKRLREPKNPCLVWFKDKVEPHIGILYNSKVLHLAEGGVLYQPLAHAIIGFSGVNYYDPIKNNN